MSKRTTVAARAKGVERKVQQYLWPGTKFAGGAKRPALEQEDLRGEDRDGLPLWGEVKNYSQDTTASEGGTWAVLDRAYWQCEAAIADNRQDWPVTARPKAFSVLWPKGSRTDAQRLVMYEFPVVGIAVVTLGMFKRMVVDGVTVEIEEAA